MQKITPFSLSKSFLVLRSKHDIKHNVIYQYILHKKGNGSTKEISVSILYCKKTLIHLLKIGIYTAYAFVINNCNRL